MALNTNPDQLSKAPGVGTVMGQSASDPIGFYGATPISQATSSLQAALSDPVGTPTANNALVDVGAAFNQATLNNNFATVAQAVAQLRLALVNLGLIKGS